MRLQPSLCLAWPLLASGSCFEIGRPDVIVVDRRENKQGFGPTRFDFEEYFNRDRRFAALMAGYDRIFDGPFRFYRRRGL
jgi:hypothetical protein